MNERKLFEPTPEQFGVFWKYISDPTVTDIDYNGKNLWITDFEKGKYRADENVTDVFISEFTNNIANAVNGKYNNANQVLEADTKELRISILHPAIATSGVSICIRKSPALIRNTIESMLEEKYIPEDFIQLLINCVRARMNFVFGGEPGAGKTECAKFFMKFIPDEDRVITIEDSLEIHYSTIKPEADSVEIRVSNTFSYRDAIKACMRQNPTWLMLSEARSTEVTNLIEEWSTGVCGFTTIHLDDLRKLPDRIQNMMNDVNDADRMENRIYEYVNIGVLIKKREYENEKTHREVDQLCFYTRENGENKCTMLIKDGKVISRKIPEDIKIKLKNANIEDPFICPDFDKLRKEK